MAEAVLSKNATLRRSGCGLRCNSVSQALCSSGLAPRRTLGVRRMDLGVVALAVGSLALVAAVVLWVGGLVSRRFPRAFRSRLSAAIHALALLASLATGFVVLVVHRHTGQPLGARDVLVLIACPALVYGAVVFLWLKGFTAAALGSLVSFFVRPKRER